MLHLILYTVFSLVLCSDGKIVTNADVYVPKVKGSYRAVGEIIFNFEGSPLTFGFEENFDFDNKMVSFWSSVAGTNTTVLENQMLNQTFMFNPTDMSCTEINPGDWDNTIVSPNLKVFEIEGQVVFPLKQLLGLDSKFLSDQTIGPATLFRDVLANRYSFNVNNIGEMVEVQAYWSDKSGGTSPSKFKEVPLAYEVIRKKTPREKPVVMRMNIFLFIHDEINIQLLQPVRGIFCPGRRGTSEFPQVKNFQSFALSAEVVIPDKELVTSVDIFVDFKNRLFRSDFMPLQSLSGVKGSGVVDFNPEAMVVAFDQGTVFHMRKDGERECRVSQVDQDLYHPQMLFDYRKQSNWEPEVFFGVKGNNFQRVGQVEEREVSCTLYQVLRSDWPPGEEGKIETLWEWCFADNLKTDDSDIEKYIHVISLNVYVTKSTYEEGSNKLFKGLRLIFHFYNARNMPPNYLNLLAFDISSCFGENRQQRISFLVDLTTEQRDVLFNLTNFVDFESTWTKGVYEAAKLTPNSLRVSNLRLSFQDLLGPMIVELTVLDHHPNMSEGIRSTTPSLDKVLASIEAAIDNNLLKITWPSKPQTLELSAKKGSFFKNPSSSSSAVYRVQQAAAEYRISREDDNNSVSPTAFWVMGVVALQMGVAVGVVVVAYRKWR